MHTSIYNTTRTHVYVERHSRVLGDSSMCLHLYTLVHTYTHTYLYMHTVYIYTYTHLYVYNTHTCIHREALTSTWRLQHVCIYIFSVYMYIHWRIYTLTHIWAESPRHEEVAAVVVWGDVQPEKFAFPTCMFRTLRRARLPSRAQLLCFAAQGRRP